MSLPNEPRRERLRALYRTMSTIRAFEDAAEEASQGGVQAFGQTAGGQARVRGPLHLSTGQEAVAAGVCLHLRREDLLTSTHRGHGHTLAKGADVGAMMAELFGKAPGTNRGKGGSMHIADFSVGMLGANGVVAAGLPIAAGAAHAQKLREARTAAGERAITACFFGDGAINRGPFLEALNWARVFGLPLLLVCEDNRWSATTASGPVTAGEGASARAAGLDIPALKVDGNDVEAVCDAAGQLVAEVRAGRGPRLLHAVTYRVKGHVSVDPAAYRDPATHAEMLRSDPLRAARARWVDAGGAPAELDAIEREARARIARAVAAADAAPPPPAELAYTDVQDTGSGRWF